MRYATAEAFRTALEQRLKNEAAASGTALIRLRKQVAFERFLARLAVSESAGWVLKGAAVRYTVRADLDGRLFEQFPADVAFSESPPIQAESLLTANALEFADVATPQLPVVSLEQHVAEKLHAYTGSYGQDTRESTRVKDLVDLVLIGELAELDAERLSGALAATFEQRARQLLPRAVPPPPSSWARPYAELAREVGIAVEIEAGYAAAARLLDPVLRLEAEGRWDPEAWRWRTRA